MDYNLRVDFVEDVFAFLEGQKVPFGTGTLRFADYMQIPPDKRSGDEMDVVDQRLTRGILGLLDYSEEDWEYNSLRAEGRPDFLIKPGGRIAFFWENKSTGSDLDPQSSQIRNYTHLSTIGVLFNGVRLIIIQSSLNRGVSPLISVDLTRAFPSIFGRASLFTEDEKASEREKLSQVHALLHRERFTRLDKRLKVLAVDEDEWLSSARPVEDVVSSFIENASGVIERIAVIARHSLDSICEEAEKYEEEIEKVKAEYVQWMKTAPDEYQLPDAKKENFYKQARDLEPLHTLPIP